MEARGDGAGPPVLLTGGEPPAISDAAWGALCRTASLVRAPDLDVGAQASRYGYRRAFLAGALLAAGVVASAHLQPTPVGADGAADSDLFSLTNQDRASNGVASLADNSTLSAIGESAPYSGCSGAGTIRGRAQDMINRDYFAHQIPPCGQYVWPIMSAYGIDYRSAGENIGWVSGEGSGSGAAQWTNNAFMNSPEHRDNILNASFTEMGVGSATGASWTCPASEGCSGTYTNVWIFAEEFAQVGSPPPPPTPRPTPPPTPRQTPPPTAPPTATPAPTPTPTPTPAPTATATPASAAADAAAPVPAYEEQGQGLLSDTIESTLEAFLFS